MGRVETCLDEVLALGLGHERLELRGGKGVYETGLRHDQEEDLSAGESGELVRLIDASRRVGMVEDDSGDEEREMNGPFS